MPRIISTEQKIDVQNKINKLNELLQEVDREVDFIHQYAKNNSYTLGKTTHQILFLSLDSTSFGFANNQDHGVESSAFKTIVEDTHTTNIGIGLPKSVGQRDTPKKITNLELQKQTFSLSNKMGKYKYNGIPYYSTATAPYIFNGKPSMINKFEQSPEATEMKIKPYNTINLTYPDTHTFSIPRFNDGNVSPFCEVITTCNSDGTVTLEKIVMNPFISVNTKLFEDCKQLDTKDAYTNELEINYPKLLILDYLTNNVDTQNINKEDLYVFDYAVRFLAKLHEVDYVYVNLSQSVQDTVRFITETTTGHAENRGDEVTTKTFEIQTGKLKYKIIVRLLFSVAENTDYILQNLELNKINEG